MKIANIKLRGSVGYTLIEILIVVSIIVLFTGLSLAYYRGFDEQRKLDAETKQLIDILNLAEKKSVAADLSPLGLNPSCSDFRGYWVSLTGTSYSLKLNCAGVDTLIQTYTLGSGMTLLVSDATVTDILFKPLYSGTNLSTPISVTLTNSSNNKCTKIQINPVGTVEQLPNCQ